MREVGQGRVGPSLSTITQKYTTGVIMNTKYNVGALIQLGLDIAHIMN